MLTVVSLGRCSLLLRLTAAAGDERGQPLHVFVVGRLLGVRMAGPSLPLDVGHSADIPAAIRRAVILRDQHCRWAGGYFL